MMNLLDSEERLKFCMERLIPLIIQVSIKYLNTNYEVENKSHGNFVTTIDKGIEKDLIDSLLLLFPDAGFISEECGESKKSDYNWIIDPIDGTTNFIHGLPYAISVALSYKSIENTIIGVVYSPKNELLYYGCKDSGSFVMEKEKQRKLHVKSFPVNEGIAIFGMPYNREKTDKIFEIAKRYYAISSDLKRIGPASLDICLVAAGKAKFYFELDLNVWDIAAGVLILTEAGGKYTRQDDLFVFANNDSFNPLIS